MPAPALLSLSFPDPTSPLSIAVHPGVHIMQRNVCEYSMDGIMLPSAGMMVLIYMVLVWYAGYGLVSGSTVWFGIRPLHRSSAGRYDGRDGI